MNFFYSLSIISFTHDEMIFPSYFFNQKLLCLLSYIKSFYFLSLPHYYYLLNRPNHLIIIIIIIILILIRYFLHFLLLHYHRFQQYPPLIRYFLLFNLRIRLLQHFNDLMIKKFLKSFIFHFIYLRLGPLL